ncbi:hypothetical protein EDC96DRAFT_518008 [Choanephora cucurbitarum]|nr:hypothetical protein EDC96DRAFT_518008 [Choanephora cucurbitarum]
MTYHKQKKPMPLLNITHHHEEYSMQLLESHIILKTKSIMTVNINSSLDNRTVRCSTNTSRLSVTHLTSEHSQSPPVSPPPLSPTMTRPSWRMVHSSTYQPACSISSNSSEEDSKDEDEDDEDDDNAPLGLLIQKPMDCLSLLSDMSEDGDDDLIPIARLSISRSNVHHLSAAEKYKAKVKARLRMDSGN